MQIHLSLVVGFEPQQAADLLRASVNNAGADVVLLVGIDAVQQFHAGSTQFRPDHGHVHRLRSLEDLLRLLIRSEGKTMMKSMSFISKARAQRTNNTNLPAEILPAGEERFRVHFCGLEKLVDAQRQLQAQPLLHPVVQKQDGQGGIFWEMGSKLE